jgi:hypothetical protein
LYREFRKMSAARLALRGCVSLGKVVLTGKAFDLDRETCIYKTVFLWDELPQLTGVQTFSIRPLIVSDFRNVDPRESAKTGQFHRLTAILTRRALRSRRVKAHLKGDADRS